MVAENSGLEFGPVNELRATGEVIKLLDDDEDDILDDDIRHDKEVKMKEEPMRKIMMKTMQTRLTWSIPGDQGENKLAPSNLKTTKYMLP